MLSLCVFQVKCFTVHENLNLMAVGFENGSIVLFRGDVTKERYLCYVITNKSYIQWYYGKISI